MHRKLFFLHRWISLILAIFWLVQAITGTLIMFHWEARDAAIAGENRATDFAGIGNTIARLEAEGEAEVGSLWTTAGLGNRFTLYLSDGSAVTVAGDGTPLAATEEGEQGLFDILVGIHHDLLAGDAGQWISGSAASSC